MTASTYFMVGAVFISVARQKTRDFSHEFFAV